ncbi:efflux RND transporter permease subunit [Salipaludibacillus daqingensis]|uniref:efflux RND transporter permease subunit n=1 Tax=Salipaludibacillus daqingensis TaxID=3041001 RepID=UPI0024755C9E|nr:efflux RND transporter permease subunit [Salipaludibacillus daqingensis]
MNVLKLLLSRKLIVGLMVALIIGIGIFSIDKLEKELMPPVSMDGGVVYLESPSLTPLEVEERVTKAAEQKLDSIDNIDSYTSNSSDGFTQITFLTDNGMGEKVSEDVERNLQPLLNEISSLTSLNVQQFSTEQPFEFYMDISKGSLEEMSRFASTVVKPRLEALPEVREVSLSGLEEKSWKISFDEEKLSENNLTVDQVVDSIQLSNQDMMLGSLDKEEGNPQIRWEQSFQSVYDLLDTRIGTIIIDDVASIEQVVSETDVEAWKDGESGFVFVEIGRADSYTQLDMAEAVREEVKLIEEEGSVNGFALNELVAQADYVQEAIDGVTQNVLIGGAIAIAILFMFLRNFRATLIVGISIPLSILLTFSTMWILGYSFNMLSMIALGLGIGMMVDASIVILEAIYRKKEQGFKGVDAVVTGVKEVASAVFASMLTTMVVFLPIGLFGGDMGAFMIVLSVVVVITLVSSLLISFTLIPTLAENFLKINKPNTKAKEGLLVTYYAKTLQWLAVKKRRSFAIIGVFIIILASSLMLTSKISVVLMPDMFNRYSELMIDVEDGLTKQEREKVADAIHNQLKPLNDVESYTIMDSRDFLYAIINMTKDDEITLEQDIVNENIISAIRELEDNQPIISVGNIMEMNGQQPVQLEISGENFEQLESVALETKNKLESIDGLTNVMTSFDHGQETEKIVLNETSLANDNVSSFEMLELINQPNNSDPITEIPDHASGSEWLPVYLAEEESPQTKEELLNVPVITLEGEKKLSDYIDFETISTPSNIERKNGERVVKVMANIENRDLGSINRDIQDWLSTREHSQNYTISLGGDLQEQQEAMTDLLLIFAISIFLVYVVMTIQFNSLKHPLIVMSIIPFTATGVIVGLLITQHELSIISSMGLLMLLGIVLNNAILLVDRTNQLKRRGISTSEAVVEAGKNRLRPVFMTTLTTVGGMLPLAIFGGASASYQAPLATIVISGLLFATTITLLLIPSLYLLLEKKDRKKQIEKKNEKIEQAS